MCAVRFWMREWLSCTPDKWRSLNSTNDCDESFLNKASWHFFYEHYSHCTVAFHFNSPDSLSLYCRLFCPIFWPFYSITCFEQYFLVVFATTPNAKLEISIVVKAIPIEWSNRMNRKDETERTATTCKKISRMCFVRFYRYLFVLAHLQWLCLVLRSHDNE